MSQLHSSFSTTRRNSAAPYSVLNSRPGKPESTLRQSRADIFNQLNRSSERVSGVQKRNQAKIDTFRQELSTKDHIIALSEVVKKYSTDLERGMNEDLAANVLARDGPNMLQGKKAKPRWILFCEFMFCGFAILLWMTVVLCGIGFTLDYIQNPMTVQMDNIYLAAMVLSVIIVTGLFGFVQEAENNAIMASFQKMIPSNATVIREGNTYKIPSEKLVVGDIVLVQGGDCVPADIRIVESTFMKVDNSSITGESDPQSRTTESTDSNPLETANLAFYGTNVVEGIGKGLVIGTGNKTLMGHIAVLTAGLTPDITPIKREAQNFVKYLSIAAILIGLIVFGLSLFVNQDFMLSFVFFVAVVISNVPEGLLVTLTACLTLTAKKMVRKNVLCKNLHAIETLGSTTVICSDKTGTLTQNRMTVSHMYFEYNVEDVLDEFNPPTSESFLMLCRVGILCSRAVFKDKHDPAPPMQRAVLGDASESAVLKAMEMFVGDTHLYRKRYPKVFEIPFNSANKYQLSIHRFPLKSAASFLVVLKGAPERVLDMCTSCIERGENVTLDEPRKNHLQDILLELGYMGERVLGFADYKLAESEFPAEYPFTEKLPFPMNNFRFVGFMSMIDPPRPGVVDAIEKCKTAGIRVVMVTGDHPITAMSIAKKVGIISPEIQTVYDLAKQRNVSVHNIAKEETSQVGTVITGNELRAMDNSDLCDVIEQYQELVFARTSPQQKLQIVEAFQQMNEIVAVTGDGVNDSPALKKADIGVAMGIAGSDVSKEAADLIILDDNFATIVTGIEEGRLIYDNLKKSIAYLLTSNVPQVLPFLTHALLGLPCALSVVSILVIDIGTDLWPSISLAYEPAESDIMLRKPRDPLKDHLVTWKLIWYACINVGFVQAIAALSCFFYVMAQHGFKPKRLLFIREEWYSPRNDVLDSYNQEWSKDDRTCLLRKAVAAAFLSLVITQIADLIICKTRRLSIIHQGMSNWVLNWGLLFEIFVGLFSVYCPYLNTFLQFEPIRLYMVFPAVPYAILIFVYDEIRKYIIRNRPGGWFEREMYW